MSLTLRSQFVRFAAVGAAGFFVDAGTLYGAMALGAGLYTGRVISYFAAATFTWALNRRFTFNAARSSNKLLEWVKFLAANALGGLVNYSVYAILVSSFRVATAHPVLGVAAGSIAGLVMNFALSRTLVFKARDAGA